jgi:hypothetical protein
MSVRQKNLAVWVQKCLVGNIKEQKGECTQLALMHRIGQDWDLIESYSITPGEPKDWAEMFIRLAETQSHDLPGSQEFCIRAFFNGKEDSEVRSPIFQVTGKGQMEDGFMTEAPDARGQRQQSMRQTEMTFQLSLKHTAILLDASSRHIAQQAAIISSTCHENREMMTLVKELVLARSREDHAIRMDQMTFERNSALLQTAARIAPGAINQITGKEIFPQATADTELLRAIAGRITNPQQLQGLQMFLGTELGAIVTNRLVDLVKEQNEVKEKSRQAAMTVATGGVTPQGNGEVPTKSISDAEFDA